MSAIEENYARAVEHGVSTDVVGAVGLAGKKHKLATALLRLFVGDDSAARDIVQMLACMAVGKAYRLGYEVRHVQAEDLARAVLAWHRDSRCKPCGGLGLLKLPGTPHLSGNACTHCRGSGRIPFDSQFPLDMLELARWMASEVDREQAIAGREAMRRLSGDVTLRGVAPGA